MNKALSVLLILLLLAGAAPAKTLSAKKVKPAKKVSARKIKPAKKVSARKIKPAKTLSGRESKLAKTQIAKLQKELTALKSKLKKTKAKRARALLMDKIDIAQIKIGRLQKRIGTAQPAKKKIVIKMAPPVTPPISLEAASEEAVSAEVAVKAAPSLFRYKIGGGYGFFAGTTALLLELRIPIRLVLGPATPDVRLATGLAQSRDTSLRFVPVNIDLLFNFPPGWFTGVDNYLGCGLNYIALMTGQKQGTVGGEVFYGVQSEGFGGIVFGEIGYAALRTGFSASHKGLTVLVGYLRPIGF